MKLVVAIDPATGASSPTGLAIFNSETRAIIMSCNVTTSEQSAHGKLRDLSNQMEQFYRYAATLNVRPILVASETFMMMNKRISDILQRLIGAYMSRIPDGFCFETVHNTTIKKLVTGRGQADKMEVALGVLYYFKDVPQSGAHILDLITKEQWDRTDAFAIGIAALYQNNPMHANSDQERDDYINEGLGVFNHERTHAIKVPKVVKKAKRPKKAKTVKAPRA
jgi:Holliday junction resolvasome RuvABC endonuclease subunit